MKKYILLLSFFFCIAGWSNTQAQVRDYKVTITDGITNLNVKQNIETNISAFLSDLKRAVDRNSTIRFSHHYLTKDAEQSIRSMWRSSEMICQQSEIEEKCLTRAEGGYEVRNIPVTLLQADEMSKYGQIVISLTPEGKIDDVYIALDEEVYSDILDHSETVEDFRRRQIIIDFIENYRTSYNRKDIKYIEQVFSDNALIITGKVIKEKAKSDAALKSLSSERIVYVKQNKTTYIKKLTQVFKANKMINVQFDDIEVLRHPKHENMYGVTLLQGWNTSNYSDVGYLFLLVDFKDDDNPLIHVRTWQPEEFQGKPLPEDEIFGIHDFNIEDVIY